MARPRSQPATSRQSTDLSKLSSEVVRLRLQQMNLPVTGNHARLVERLRSANGTRQLSATTRNKRADGRVAKRSSTSSKRSQQAARSLASELHDLDQVLDHLPEEEESATSDLLVDLNAEPMESMEPSDVVFTPAQLAAIQDTVSSTVQAAFQSLPHNDVIPPAPAFFSTPSPRVSSVAPPNGLNRPLDKALEDKILRAPTTNPMTAPTKNPAKSLAVCPRLLRFQQTLRVSASYLSLPPQLPPLWIQQSRTLQLPQLQTACHKHQISNPGRLQQRMKWNSASRSRDQQYPPLLM